MKGVSAMVKTGRKKGEYRFVYNPSGKVQKVALAGSFNNWKPQPMTKQKTGEFSITIPLAAGYYEYKFIVDGTWVEDKDNGSYSFNPYGTLNSVLKAE
jgi:1,4-alpha-glucan branching enzyme